MSWEERRCHHDKIHPARVWWLSKWCAGWPCPSGKRTVGTWDRDVGWENPSWEHQILFFLLSKLENSPEAFMIEKVSLKHFHCYLSACMSAWVYGCASSSCRCLNGPERETGLTWGCELDVVSGNQTCISASAANALKQWVFPTAPKSHLKFLTHSIGRPTTG